MDVVLLATTNPAKIREFHRLLGGLPVRLVEPREIGKAPAVVESGDSFLANALIKARAYATWSGISALSDDGGLEIDAIGGAPGIRSRRWLDPNREATDRELIAHTLACLDGVPPGLRGAGMRCAEALVCPDGETVTGEAVLRGEIATSASDRIDPGFPFRSLFYVPGAMKLYVDLTAEEHERHNHRREALRPICTRLLGP